jgi:hypothetical protein
MGRSCSTHREVESAYNILVGKPEGSKPLERSRHVWEDNIRMNLREIGWEGMDCIHLVEDRDWW